jgi:hypothetical protein
MLMVLINYQIYATITQLRLGMEVHAWNHSYSKAEVGRSWSQAGPYLNNKQKAKGLEEWLK